MIFYYGIIASQINKYLAGCPGSVGEYNANNTWYFNGNNRYLNNNNRYNSNFRSRPCSDYIASDNKLIQSYTISLEKIQEIEEISRSSKTNCIRFRTNKIQGIIEVWHKINNLDVKIVNANVFTAKVPKLREIIYCNYSDKLVQSFYVISLKWYLEDRWYDKDSYSCRDNKGVLKAINTYRNYLKIVSKDFTEKEVYLASIDIKRFFLSIDSRILAEKMAEFIQNNLREHDNYKILLYLTECLYVINWHMVNIERIETEESSIVSPDKTLLSNDPYIGVPIGNWPSQIGGNFITTFALVFIRGLGYDYFIHYTDDTNIILTDKQKFLKDIILIEQFYREVLHLELHKNKRYLQHYSKGILILGRRIKFNRCIASKMTINSIDCLVYGVCRNFIKDETYIKNNCESFSQSINSYFGMLVHMTMFNYRKITAEQIKRILGKYFIIDDKNFTKINVKKKYTRKQRYINNIKVIKKKYGKIW